MPEDRHPKPTTFDGPDDTGIYLTDAGETAVVLTYDGEPRVLRAEIAGTLRTGPSGQIWDVDGKLRARTRYAIVELEQETP